ncbi:MAG: 23S rRNA (adenine(2503)-C(2))-methyltransferase RlmN [Phycisphaerales bacterium]|nr:23S rRNA (adenine(2503)-C(2))-methyltransferase RlmN [Phycisphaerales bacterium]
MLSFFDLDPTSLESFCADHDMPRHRADQILRWVYRQGVVDPSAMTNVSAAHRDLIAEQVEFYRGELLASALASDGTHKLLLGWDSMKTRPAGPSPLPVLAPTGGPSDRSTETVLIPTEDRRTACLSSQVGCPVGCRFCASGLGGLEGNLDAGQIVEQAHRLSWLEGGSRVSNVVFMGMGEPLANATAVMQAIRTLNAPWGMGIGARRITVSTVGLPAAIRRFAHFELPVTLALSLHAPDDDLRRELIPWAKFSTIEELLDACRAYFEQSGREITLEYLLLGGVNDRSSQARELARLARTLRANVNLIRYNEVDGLPYRRPTDDDVLGFQRILRRASVNAHIRASRGRDIAAACGQLRREQRAH